MMIYCNRKIYAGFIALMMLVLVLDFQVKAQSKRYLTKDYYVGTSAEREDLQKARAEALEDLLQRIQVFVRSEFKRYREETNNYFADSTIASVIARSSMNLSDVEEDMERSVSNLYRITKYVPKASVERMFEIRREKILEHLDIAQLEQGKVKVVKSVNLGTVLRNYYLAFLLSYTLRDHDTISYAFYQDDITAGRISKDLKTGIPYTLENVINDVQIRLLKRIEDANVVWKCAVEYKGVPISNLTYSFYDGAGTTYGEAKNGETIFTFFFPTKESREREIDVKIEYQDEEGLDELLQLAKTLSARQKLAEIVTFKLPSDDISILIKKTEPKIVDTALTQAVKIPSSISELMAVHESWGKTKPVLMELNRRKHIIIGRKEDFESTEGLFILTVDKNGAVTLLRCSKDMLCDLLTDKKFSLKDFAGRPIYWIEALK